MQRQVPWKKGSGEPVVLVSGRGPTGWLLRLLAGRPDRTQVGHRTMPHLSSPCFGCLLTKRLLPAVAHWLPAECAVGSWVAGDFDLFKPI